VEEIQEDRVVFLWQGKNWEVFLEPVPAKRYQ